MVSIYKITIFLLFISKKHQKYLAVFVYSSKSFEWDFPLCLPMDSAPIFLLIKAGFSFLIALGLASPNLGPPQLPIFTHVQ